MTRTDQSLHHEQGWYQPIDPVEPVTPTRLKSLLYQTNQPVIIVQTPDGHHLATGNGRRVFEPGHDAVWPVYAVAYPLSPEAQGDDTFCTDWNLGYPIIGGSMANGISSVDLVTALAEAGMMGFYGSAGQALDTVEQAIVTLKKRCGSKPWGVNLIHSPQEPASEERLVDLFLHHHVDRIEASAYMLVTRALVRYRVHGIHVDETGRTVAPHRILAKASRVEVAEKFFSPPPEALVHALVAEGFITQDQAVLCRGIPLASDVTAEADSGGHTDNRPLVTLFPSFVSLSRRQRERFPFTDPLRVGAAGGIGTPSGAAAAFAMGAAWLLVGSIAQSAIESGTSDAVREMLAEVRQAEIAMAPAADMFEMGVTVQVLKRGTLFPMRARKLYDVYREYDAIESIPASVRTMLERTIFRSSLDAIWEETRRFWMAREPDQVQRAERDPHHRMALAFRWYLGRSSRWANSGDPDRKQDYQVWCGPAMSAFNLWVQGSQLAAPCQRRIKPMLMNILWGAAVSNRATQLRNQGVPVPQHMFEVEPQSMDTIRRMTGRERISP
ncbi:PfaD family polyunsaturated fatty acid/polyketide biosynthesis protein [bacterium]|nr:PfaD family polyunsaturated fatty acid/polyketide biosynthesis protein [candidate division CSSED10-310 bacterium]